MERERTEEDVPRAIETPVEPPIYGEHERLERLLRGVVHTILATYRLKNRTRVRVGTAGRLRRARRDRAEGMGC